MKRFKRMFQEAERLTPPPGLWRQIEAQVEMKAGGRQLGAGFWQAPALRVAASVVLAVGLLGLGLLMQQRPKELSASMASVKPDGAELDSEIVDSELLGWHADLGELDEEADEAEEML